jgi:hypothetical protein
MKKTKFRFKIVHLVFILILSSCASSKQVQIKEQFSEYLNAYQSEQFEKAADFITEEYFEYFPREMLISSLKKVYTDTEKTEMVNENFRITNISKPTLIDDKYYSLITFSGVKKRRYLNDKRAEESENEFLERMYQVEKGMQRAFGENNVKYDVESKYFIIIFEQSYYGILNENDTKWKFLIVDEGQQKILKQLIPNELLGMK